MYSNDDMLKPVLFCFQRSPHYFPFVESLFRDLSINCKYCQYCFVILHVLNTCGKYSQFCFNSSIWFTR